jgi:hypothetical protein
MRERVAKWAVLVFALIQLAFLLFGDGKPFEYPEYRFKESSGKTSP